MPAHTKRTSHERKPMRRALIVDLPFQMRALLPLIGFAGLYAATMGLAFYYRLYPPIAAESDLALRALLHEQLWQVQRHFWLLLGLAGVLAAYYSLHWSQRVAGPVYHLHRTLKDMAEGELKSFRLRPGDEFRVFEEDVAVLSQKMKLLASRNRDILLTVHTQVKKLSDRLAAEATIPRPDLQEAVEFMRAQLEKAPELTPAARR